MLRIMGRLGLRLLCYHFMAGIASAKEWLKSP